MAIDFPASPTTGQTFTSGSVTYTWDGVKWTAVAAGGGATDKIEEGNSSVEVIDTGSDGRVVFTTEGNEVGRFDSSGRLGVGTTSPGTTLHLYAAQSELKIQSISGTTPGYLSFLPATHTNPYYVYADSNRNLIFEDFATERMRIDSSGRLLVGTSSTWAASVEHQFRTVSGSNWALNINSPSGGSPSHLLIATGRNSSGDNMIRVETNHNGLGGAGTTLRFRVDGGGVIYASNTTVQSTSDERLKENIRNSEDGLAVINQLRPVRFDWKQNQTFNQGTNQLGFIAQEVEAVFPEAVGVAPLPSDFTGDDPEYKTVGPGAFIPVLVKALQEASAKIETLEAKVAALEAS